jgi:predicted transcriptional regulator
MGNKEKIYNELKKRSMTSTELSESLSIELQSVRIYLLRLKKLDKIESFDKIENGELIYRIKGQINSGEAIELLKFLNDMFKTNFKFLRQNKTIKEFVMKNADKFAAIEELVN